MGHPFHLPAPALVTRMLRALRRLFKALVRTLGVVALLMLVLAFTRIPFDVHRWLGTAAGLCMDVPEAVVVLGGSGMPSGPELLRLHHAAAVANAHPLAQVWVVHPIDSGVVQAMVDELVLRGVGGERIHAMMEGTNTREQWLRLWALHPSLREARLALVTSPEHMYRALHAARRVGFAGACGVPAFDRPMFIDLRYGHQRIGGRPYVPDVSGSYSLRYDLWNRLHLQLACLRELVALGYYRANGWI